MTASSVLRRLLVLAATTCAFVWICISAALATNTLTCPSSKLDNVTFTSVQLSGANLVGGKVVTPPSNIVVTRAAVGKTGDALSMDGGRPLGTCTLTFDKGSQPTGLNYLKLTLTSAFLFGINVSSSGTRMMQKLTLKFATITYAQAI
jgi:hypothetical protein